MKETLRNYLVKGAVIGLLGTFSPLFSKHHKKPSTHLQGHSLSEAVFKNKINKIVRSFEGTIGLFCVDLKTGYSFGLHESELFPMASVYKLPIALALLDRIEHKYITLDDRVVVNEGDIRVGDGILSKRFVPGMTISYRDLVRLMLEASDNTATDLILKEVGGPSTVTRWLLKHGITDMRVDRSTLRMIADYYGVTGIPRDENCPLALYRSLQKRTPASCRHKSSHIFLHDVQDTCTPRAMVTLLTGIYNRTFLKHSSHTLLLDGMRLCHTGERRIRALLPPGTAVFQKTGTLCGIAPTDRAITNDVGIIELPGKNSALIIAIFIKGSSGKPSQREKVIARLTKLLFQYCKKI